MKRGEEHTMRMVLSAETPGERRSMRLNLLLKDTCRRDTTIAGLREDDGTNRAE